MKIFISYSHRDEDYINEFRKHISPLRKNEQLHDWYDRKILGGDDFQEKIDNNLNDADIICLFISHNFIASDACNKEIVDSLQLRKDKGIRVICIILSPCAWTDVKGLKELLAMPTDGTPISSYADNNTGWLNVYNQLKQVIKYENCINELDFSQDFKSDLSDTTVFKRAHGTKKELLLDDIYVFPELLCFNEEKGSEKVVSAETLTDIISKKEKIIIKGDDQSGKTSLAKRLCSELKTKRYTPIYLTATDNGLLGNVETMLNKAFDYQYNSNLYDDIDINRIIPIIDDFHKVKNKGKLVNSLSKFKYCVLIVDFRIGVNFKDNILLGDYKEYQIKEFKPSLIDSLIRKWIGLDKTFEDDPSLFYKELDSKTKMVMDSIGKVLDQGIMPAYPFFILSMISTSETFQKPIDQEITSQGYCYQALILFFLSKASIKSDEIDYYINFLSEFAYELYCIDKIEINEDDFCCFFDRYEEKYHTIDRAALLDNLLKSQLLYKSISSNYSFCYLYIYYYFCGKYFSDNISSNSIKIELENVISNLHINENAYITIFISHHSKNINILDDIQISAMLFFEKYSPVTLSKAELIAFDSCSEIIVQASLPEKNDSERERYIELQKKDNESEITPPTDLPDEDEEPEFAVDLRRSIKTVEVIGHIIKNRAGSIEKSKIDEMCTEAINVYLRLLSYFFGLIQDEKSQSEIIEFLMQRINVMLSRKYKDVGMTREALEKSARKIFWHLNFGVVYSIIHKASQSLGSSKITSSIVVPVCDKINTPASNIIKHMCLMWYNKSLRVPELCKIAKDDNYSMLAKNIISINLSEYSRLNGIDYKDKDKLRKAYNIESNQLLKR